MKKRVSLVAVFALIFAAVLMFCPQAAHADTIELSQADFTSSYGEDKEYWMSPGNTYKLTENVYGAVFLYCPKDDRFKTTTLDLNGYTLTTREDYSTVSTGTYGKLVVKNGNLVQQDPNFSLVKMRSGYATLTLDLGEGHTGTSNGRAVVETLGSGFLTFQSGTFGFYDSVSGSDNPFIRGTAANVYVKGGTLNAAPGNKLFDGSKTEVYGGSFNVFPENVGRFGGGVEAIALVCDSYNPASYTVLSRSDALENYSYSVTGVDRFEEVFFATLADAKAFNAARGGDASDVHDLSCTVTFNPNGGTKDGSTKTWTLDTKIGLKVAEPTVTREGYFLLGWTPADSTSYYNFDSTLTGDITLTAQWAKIVATIDSTPYASLQEAINAAEPGQTVTLAADTSESVKIPAGDELTIDLGGHQLWAQSGKAALELSGTRTLTIINGQVFGDNNDCLLLAKGSDASNVTLGDSEHNLVFKCISGSSADNAVCVRSNATVNFVAGEFSSTADSAVLTYTTTTDAEIVVQGGTFASGSANTLKINAGTCTISGGSIATHVLKNNSSRVSLSGGTFGDNTNRGDVADGYALIYEGGKYKPVVVDTAKEAAGWVITDGDATKVYYADSDYSVAKADYDEIKVNDEKATLKALCRVRFFSDGSQVELRYLEAGDTLGELPDPGTVEGKTFGGWYAGDTKVGADTEITDTMVVVASWTEDVDPGPAPESYTVTFDSKGGTYVEPIVMASGGYASAPDPAPTRQGYTFAGWYEHGASTEFDFVTTPIISDITLEAHWTEDTDPEPSYCVVTFDLNDTTGATFTQKVAEGSCATKPENPIRQGYTFDCWLYAGAPYDFATPVESNLTLTAKWTQDVKPTTYTVTFDSNGGTTIDSQTVVKGQAATEPEAPTKLGGAVFSCWELDGNTYDFKTPVEDNITLKAAWTDPVASFDGVGYPTLQAALDTAAKNGDGGTVKLLCDTEENVAVSGVSDLTIDLNNKTLTGNDSSHQVILASQCESLTITNGAIKLSDSVSSYASTSGIHLGLCNGFTLSDLNVSIARGTGDAIYISGSDDENKATSTIDGGTYSSENGYALVCFPDDLLINDGDFSSGAVAALWCEDSTLTVNNGSFTAKEGASDDDTADRLAAVLSGGSATINNGTFAGYIELNSDAALTINNGSFSFVATYLDESDTSLTINAGEFVYPDNIDALAEGKAFLKAKGGTYQVVDDAKAWEECKAWIVLGDYNVYYADNAEAAAIVEEAADTEITIHEVKLLSRGNLVKTAYVVDGLSIGRLPAGEQVAGYTFAGWFDGTTAVDADFVPTGATTLVAKWTKDGSSELVDNPGDSGNTGKLVPKTADGAGAVGGIGVVGMLLASLGLLRRQR